VLGYCRRLLQTGLSNVVLHLVYVTGQRRCLTKTLWNSVERTKLLCHVEQMLWSGTDGDFKAVRQSCVGFVKMAC